MYVSDHLVSSHYLRKGNNTLIMCCFLFQNNLIFLMHLQELKKTKRQPGGPRKSMKAPSFISMILKAFYIFPNSNPISLVLISWLDPILFWNNNNLQLTILIDNHLEWKLTVQRFFEEKKKIFIPFFSIVTYRPPCLWLTPPLFLSLCQLVNVHLKVPTCKNFFFIIPLKSA